MWRMCTCSWKTNRNFISILQSGMRVCFIRSRETSTQLSESVLFYLEHTLRTGFRIALNFRRQSFPWGGKRSFAFVVANFTCSREFGCYCRHCSHAHIFRLANLVVVPTGRRHRRRIATMTKCTDNTMLSSVLCLLCAMASKCCTNEHQLWSSILCIHECWKWKTAEHGKLVYTLQAHVRRTLYVDV